MIFPHGTHRTNVSRFPTKISCYIMFIFAMSSIGAFLPIDNEVTLRVTTIQEYITSLS